MLSDISAKESQDIWRILKSVRRTRHIGIVLAEDSCIVDVRTIFIVLSLCFVWYL